MIVTRHCEVPYPSRWTKQGSYGTSDRQLLFKGEISGVIDATVTYGLWVLRRKFTHQHLSYLS